MLHFGMVAVFGNMAVTTRSAGSSGSFRGALKATKREATRHSPRRPTQRTRGPDTAGGRDLDGAFAGH